MAELLAPAGNPEALDAAINEGADAVYLGLKSFNARLRSTNFAWSQFEATVESLHKRGKKVLVAVNTVLQESETERMYRFLSYLSRIGPDGIIVQDFGTLHLARSFFPSLRLHASTQMNIASARAANTMSRSGVSRVVLARELSLTEVRDIKARSSCELEVFVHGALCVSESGLCLFSSYLGGKSANRGMCAQACRRLYTTGSGANARQGYFFSPHDLQLIDSIPDLVQAGIHSFKIEGRMKSAEYVGTVVSAYRYVLDNWEQDRKGAVETARRILANDFARKKTRYWYDSTLAENVLNPDQAGGTGIFLGKIDKQRETGEGHEVLLKGGSYDPDEGDSVRVHKKDDSVRESHKIKKVVTDAEGKWIDIPEGFGRGDAVYLIQTKNMTKRYPHVLPNDLSRYRSQPGADKLPPLPQAPLVESTQEVSAKKSKKIDPDFPDGVYVQVSTLDDLFMILTDRPVRVIVEINQETIPALLGLPNEKTGAPSPVIPFAKREIILSLDPFSPQAQEDGLSTMLDELVENGYRHFIVNNPAHIGMLRNRGLKLISGPYLYAFNRWAVDWLKGQGLQSLVCPIEISRDTLEASIDAHYRSQVFVTVFAYPALFRMRFKLPESYDFDFFQDRQGGVFRALSTKEGSYVVPLVPFSIADKGAMLNKIGFTRHIIDISRSSIRRQDFRAVMDSYRKGKILPEISRFNWKDGFYDPERIEEQKSMNERAALRQKKAGPSDKGQGRPGRGAKPGAEMPHKEGRSHGRKKGDTGFSKSKGPGGRTPRSR